MSSIPYPSLPVDDEMGDLEKFLVIRDLLSADELIDTLDQRRGRGRRDFSNRSLWNAFLACLVFQHKSISSLLRELRRNAQLRALCGIVPHDVLVQGCRKRVLAPSSAAFSRFLRRLTRHTDLIRAEFDKLRDILYDELPDFGECLALDGKFIDAFARRPSKRLHPDGRTETEADHAVKMTRCNDGRVKKEIHYGYRVHVIVEAAHELPVEFAVTPASVGEPTVAKKIIPKLHNRQRKQAKYLIGDRGFDGLPLLSLIKEEGMIPIIDKRALWKKEPTRRYRETDLIYNESGEVFHVGACGQAVRLHYRGYDRQTDSLRYGFAPREKDERVFRIKREEDPRIFNQVARDSKKFWRLYKKRTAVERVNGRLDRDFEFEEHTIRGLKKMTLYVTLSYAVMLAFAVGKVRRGIHEGLSSWVA